MQLPLAAGLGIVCLLFAAPSPHGGRYPPVVTPPRPPSPAPVYGGPSDANTRSNPSTGRPSSPRPAGPATPGAATSVPSTRRGSTPPRGIAVEADFTSWNYWWEFNQHAYLRLKDAVYASPEVGSEDYFMGARTGVGRDGGLRPADDELRAQVLPALRRALALPDQRDITTAAMIALAKTDLVEAEDLAAIGQRLHSDLPVVREAAALALGLTGRAACVDDLVALARDSARGRQCCGQAAVDYRLRSFAIYALGLIGRNQPDLAAKAPVLAAIAPLLAEDELRWDIKLAAISALRLLDMSGTRSYHRERLQYEATEALWRYFEADRGRGEVMVQAHVPTAIAAVLGRGGDRTGRFTRTFASELLSTDSTRALIAQSCALALGALATPTDRDTCSALRRGYEQGKDLQTRFFCLIALGRIGGADNRAALLTYFDRGNKALEKPWAALALGLLAHDASSCDRGIGEVLRRELGDNKNDLTRAACAVALGLARYREAADDLLAVLRDDGNRDPLAGYVGLGLGLMGEDRALPELRALVAAGQNRPGLLVQAATALAVLGDKGAQELLTGDLAAGTPSLLQLSADAQALALIGDRRSLATLLALAADEGRTRLVRGYALVGLGGVSDRDPLPWHAALAADLNYQAVLETLLDGAQGVLDIL